MRSPRLDAAEYVEWARRLAAGNFAWPIVSQHGPGYPLFLAALLVIFAGSLKAALFAQAGLGAATATLIALAGREVFNSRAGLFAGLVYAVYGPAVLIETSFLATGLLLFLLTMALLLLCSEPLTKVRAAVAGLAFGAAAVVRPTALAIVAACALWIALRHGVPRVRRLGFGVLLVGCCLLALAPVVAKNWSVSHSIELQGYGGLNFYIGNSPLHDGRATFRLGKGWYSLNSEAARAGVKGAFAQDRYYVAKAFAEIKKQPAAFMKLLATKALWTVQAEEVRDTHSYYFFTQQVEVLRALPRMAILLPLAAMGLIAFLERRKRASILVFFALGAAATEVFFVVGMRYRMPLVPALAIFGGGGGGLGSKST